MDYALRDDMDDEIKENIIQINNGELKYTRVIDEKGSMNLNDKYIYISKYLKANKYTNGEYYMVTRYQGVNIGEDEYKILKYIIDVEIFTFDEVISQFGEYKKDSIKDFICFLLNVEAIYLIND